MESLDLNMVIISGTVVGIPEVKYSKAGKCILNFEIVSEQRRGKYLNQHKAKVQAWDALAEAFQNMRGGEKILIQGSWASRDWDKDGKVYTFFSIAADQIQPLTGSVDFREDLPAGEIPAPLDTPVKDDDIPF